MGDRWMVGIVECHAAERATGADPDGHQSAGGRRQRPDMTCSSPSTGISFHDAAAALLNGASSGFHLRSHCFADPGDQQAGNAPRYFKNLFSQGIANADLGLRKQFKFRENMKLQFRLEAFNAFNGPASIGRLSLGRRGFGQVTSMASGWHARQMQIVARFEF